MRFLFDAVSTEIAHYKSFASKSKSLLISVLLRALAQPFFAVFLNAFLWKESKTFLALATYNIAFFIGIPFGFLLNGLLLRRIAPAKLYAFSMIAESLIIGTLIFSHETSLPFLLLFGVLYGVMAGLYWANRNTIELQFVDNNDRHYFNSFQSAAASIIGIVLPFAIGWLLVLGEKTGLYTTHHAYEFLVLIAVVILLFAGKVLLRRDGEITRSSRIFMSERSHLWKKMELTCFLIGFSDAVTSFMPALMILYLVGNESALGTITSISAIVGAIGIYIIGRVTLPSHRPMLAKTAIVVLIASSIMFAVFYSPLAAILFNIGIAIYELFFSNSHNTIVFRTIEYDQKDATLHYAHLVDREFFLNAGRVAGGIIFVALVLAFSPDTALRFSPIILALTQLPLIYLFPYIFNHHKQGSK